MADREKVVGHLYDCLAASRLENTWVFVRKNIVGDAIALLKEQGPVEPKVIIDTWVCGNCGTRLERQSMVGDNILFTERFEYCPSCGRKVLWGG